MKKLMTLAVGSLCLAAAGSQAATAAPATQPRINDCQADPTDDVMPFTDFEALLLQFQDMVDDHRFRYAGYVDYDVYERLVQYPILVAVEAFFNGEVLEAYGAYNSMVQSGQHNAAVIERVQDAERQMKQYFDTYNLGCSRYENFHNQYMSLLAYSKVVDELSKEIYATYNITDYPNCPQHFIDVYQEQYFRFEMDCVRVKERIDKQQALIVAGMKDGFKEWTDCMAALNEFQTEIAYCFETLDADKDYLQKYLDEMQQNASPTDADKQLHAQWQDQIAEFEAQYNANMEKLMEYRDQYSASMPNASQYLDVLSRFQAVISGLDMDKHQLFYEEIEASYSAANLSRDNDAFQQRFNALKQRNDAFAQQLNQAWAEVANYAEVKAGIEELKSNFAALVLKIAEAVNKNEALFTPYAKRGDEIAARLRLIGKNADDIMAAGVFSSYYEELISEVRNLEFDINKLAADFDKAKQSTMSDYDRFEERRDAWYGDWQAFLMEVFNANCPSGVNNTAFDNLKNDVLAQLNAMLKGGYKEISGVSEQSYKQNYYNYDRTLFALEDQLADLKEDFNTRVEALKRAAQTDGTSHAEVVAAVGVAAEELLAIAAQYQERLNVLEHYSLTPLVQLYSDMQENIVAAQTYAESVKAKGGAYVAEEEAKFDLGSLTYMKDQLAERFNSFMTKWNVLAQNASLQAEISYKVHDVRSTVDNAYWKVLNYQIPEGVNSNQPFEDLIQQYSASIRQLYETLSDCVNTIDSNMLTQLGLQSMSDSADTALAQTEALLKSFENVWKQTLQYYASSDLLNCLDLKEKVREELGYIASKLKPLYGQIDEESDPDKRAALNTLLERYNTIYLLLNDMQSYLELARQEGRYTEAYHAQQTQMFEDYVAQVKQAEASCQAALDGYGNTVDADRLPTLLELDRLMMIDVQQGSETLNQSRVPESLNGTKVGANLEDYVSTALGGYKELVSAPAAEVDYNVRVIVAFGGISQATYDEYVAQIYAVKAQAEDYVLKFAETWAVLCEKGQQLVATQADLDALEMEINIAIAELEQRLEALNANSQHKAPARIDGNALSGERKAIEEALASYNALLAKVQQAKEQLGKVENTLYYPERVDASTFAPVPALVAECRQSREQFRQIRDIYKYNMEEAGVSMGFDADAFYATRGALRNDIDHFILMLNDNLADGENFSDHHVMQQAKGTPIYGLFWQMNNDAQREYTPRYCYAAAEILAESSQLSNEELALRADEFLSRLYTLKTAAQAYENEWWNRFYNYSEDIYMYHDYSVRMSGFNDKLDAAEAYFNSLVVNPNDPYADNLNKLIADYKARLQDIRNQAQDISNGIYRPESFEEFEAACEALWSLECANPKAPVVESVIDVLLRDFRGTYANMSSGQLPHIDLDTLWANLNSAADEIDRFVYMLNNEYFVPAGIEGSYIYNALWQFNNDVQDEYIKNFRDPALKIISTARSYEREGKLDGLYEQAPIFMQQILDIKTYADNYVNAPYGYKYQYQQMLNEAYDYIALKQGIAELREECQKTQAEMQAYLADVTGVGADARQMLERYVEDGVMGMAAMLEQLAELELEVLNMKDSQMLELYKERLQALRDELYKRREGVLNGWREVTGSLPGQVGAALFAEFLEFYQKADALQSVCQKSMAVAEAQLNDCPSNALYARLQNVAFQCYDPAREALVRVMVEANAAQAMGNFTQEYIERVKVVVDQFNSVVNECNNIAALIKQYQALIGEADAFIAAGSAKYQELAALSETSEGEVADMQGATAYECNALASQVITFEAEFQYDWMETSDVEELMENFRNMLTKMKQEYDAALAKYEYFMSEREFGNSTADELLYVLNAQIDLNKNATMECFSEEYEMLYNADLLCRCETYEGLRDTYTKMFAVNEASLNQLRAAMEESQQQGTFVLDAEGFKARIRKSDAYRRATVEQFNKDMSLLADKMEAERRMRYGIVEDTKQYDELLYINTYVANAGENVTVPVNVKNDYPMSSISFTVEVPEEAMGYIPTVSNYVNVTTDERTNYCSVNVAYSETYNTVDVIITPAVGATIPAGDGTVVNIEMANVAVGDYPVMVNNVAYVDTNGNVVTVDKVYGTVRAVDVESFGEADSETVAEVVEDITSEVVSYTAYARDEPIRPDDDPSQRADSRRRAAATPSDPAAAHRALLEKYDVNGDGRLTIGDITTYIRLMTEKSKK